MRTLVVYYSLEGNTQYVADKICGRIGADSLRLIPVKHYSDKGVRKFLWGGMSAVMKEKPELQDHDVDLLAYDRVMIGFPVWAGTFAPPVRTFVEENREALSGKDIVVFACQAGNGAEKAIAKFEKLIEPQRIKMSAIFIDPKSKPSIEKDKEIDAFTDKLEKSMI